MIDIRGMDRAKVLAALYNASRVRGIGFLANGPEKITIAEARELLKKQTYFDYLYGRVMKVNLKGNQFDERLYDRDNGYGAAEDAITSPEE